MTVQKTLRVSGNARPSVKDLGNALELLKRYGAPEDRLVKATTATGGDWSLEVQWDPAAVEAEWVKANSPGPGDPETDPEPDPELDAVIPVSAAPRFAPRKLRDNPQA